MTPRQMQWAFRSALGALRGFGLGSIFYSPVVSIERQEELRKWLRETENEVRERYRDYQRAHGSKHLAHPTKTRWDLEEEKLHAKQERNEEV